MKRIQLTHGLEALIDDEDLDLVLSYNPIWHAHWHRHTYYACAVRLGGPRYIMRMHRLILATPSNLEVDHIDRNGLNNQRSNIRNVTRQINALNMKEYSNNTSGAKGVYWAKRQNKWAAYIDRNRTKHHLGYFLHFKEAVAARIAAEQELK